MKTKRKWTEADYQAYVNRRKAASEVKPAEKETIQKGHADTIGAIPEDRMNGVERKYSETVLDPMRLAGEITAWSFEGLKFRAAGGAFYKPDFNLFYPDGRLVNIEIKGGIIHEASRVRFLAVQERFPWFGFKLIQYNGGSFIDRTPALTCAHEWTDRRTAGVFCRICGAKRPEATRPGDVTEAPGNEE